MFPANTDGKEKLVNNIYSLLYNLIYMKERHMFVIFFLQGLINKSFTTTPLGLTHVKV